MYFAYWHLTVLSLHGSAGKLGCSQLLSRAIFCSDMVISCESLPSVGCGDRECGEGGTWGWQVHGFQALGSMACTHCSALCPGEAEVSTGKGRLDDLSKDVRYTEAVSTNQFLVPSELVLADTGMDCQACTCTHKSKQGDFLLLPAASDLKCSRKWVKPTGL